MEDKKSATDLTAHLSLFVPDYPIKKGYIARLLLAEKKTAAEVCNQVNEILKIAEPGKEVNEESFVSFVNKFNKTLQTTYSNFARDWPLLVCILKAPVSITFKPSVSLPLQQQHASTSATEPQEATMPTSVSLKLEPSLSILSPSLKRLKRHCDICVTKQRTISNMQNENDHLRMKLSEQRNKYKEEQTGTVIRLLKQQVNRKTESAALWKSKHAACQAKLVDIKVLQNVLSRSEMKANTLLKDLQTGQEEIRCLNEQVKQLSRNLEMSDEHCKKTKSQYYKNTVQLKNEMREMKSEHEKEIMRVRRACNKQIAFLENQVVTLQEENEDEEEA